jgi:hypothetical protein
MKKPARASTDSSVLAHRIEAAHAQFVKSTVEGAVAIGRMLLAAKEALGHGKFTKMVEGLSFGPRQAQRYLQIATNTILSNPSHGTLLPGSVRTLSELARLPDEILLARLKDGSVTPRLERREVERWLAPSVTVPRTVVATVEYANRPIKHTAVAVVGRPQESAADLARAMDSSAALPISGKPEDDPPAPAPVLEVEPPSDDRLQTALAAWEALERGQRQKFALAAWEALDADECEELLARIWQALGADRRQKFLTRVGACLLN